MRRFCLAGSFLSVLLGCVGCSSSSDRKGAAPAARVTGTVTLDGKPLPTGELHFSVPGYAPMVLEVKDGKYEGEAPVGKNEVQLFIFVEGPPVARYGGRRLKSNVAPPKYWGPKTVLAATVSATVPMTSGSTSNPNEAPPESPVWQVSKVQESDRAEPPLHPAAAA